MDSKEYVINELNILKEIFPISVEYDFDEENILHSIKIIPSKMFNMSEFLNWENGFLDRFFAFYPFESITFGLKRLDYPISSPKKEDQPESQPSSDVQSETSEQK